MNEEDEDVFAFDEPDDDTAPREPPGVAKLGENSYVDCGRRVEPSEGAE